MGAVDTRGNGAVVAELRRILRDEIQVDLPDGEVDLIDSGILDSLTFVDLIYHVERAFQVSIDITAIDLDDLRTLDRLARFIEAGRDRS